MDLFQHATTTRLQMLKLVNLLTSTRRVHVRVLMNLGMQCYACALNISFTVDPYSDWMLSMTLTADENGPGMFEPLSTCTEVPCEPQLPVAMMGSTSATGLNVYDEDRVSQLSEYSCSMELGLDVHGEQWSSLPYTPQHTLGPTLYQYVSPVTSFERSTTYLHSPVSTSSPATVPVPFLDLEANISERSNAFPSVASQNHLNSLEVELVTGRHGPVRILFAERCCYFCGVLEPTRCLSRYLAVHVRQRHTRSILRTTSRLPERKLVRGMRQSHLQLEGPAAPTCSAVVSERHTAQ